jgi:hypothetical protein
MQYLLLCIDRTEILVGNKGRLLLEFLEHALFVF